MFKIAFIDFDFSVLGGVEKVTERLANNFANFYDVHIISINKSNKDINYNLNSKIKLSFLNNKVPGRLRNTIKESQKKLHDYLKDNNIDIAFCMGHYACLVSVFSKFFLKTKLVFCDHGALINQWNDKSIRYIRKFNSVFTNHTVVLTDKTKKDYLELFHFNSKKISRIYNFIPEEIILKNKNIKYNLNTKKIITVSRLSSEKGLNFLLDIAILFLFVLNFFTKSYTIVFPAAYFFVMFIDSIKKKEYKNIKSIFVQGVIFCLILLIRISFSK